MIELKELTPKNLILKRATNLQGSTYSHISIRYDMTKMEREQHKKLVVEAKKMEAESGGKHQYRVRGPPWDMKVKQLKPKEDQGEEKE